MAIMINVPSRGTDTRKLIKEAARITLKRYLAVIFFSVSLNILFIAEFLIYMGVK